MTHEGCVCSAGAEGAGLYCCCWLPEEDARAGAGLGGRVGARVGGRVGAGVGGRVGAGVGTGFAAG